MSSIANTASAVGEAGGLVASTANHVDTVSATEDASS
jgi:hypothetical protein